MLALEFGAVAQSVVYGFFFRHVDRQLFRLFYYWRVVCCFLVFPITSEWKLFFVTGFLGSLTTFSAFSMEVVENILNDKFAVGIGLIAAHVFGSLLFTLFGVWLMRYVLK